ncbi:3'-5' exonuclease [Rhodobaculum claviforme]|uniref:DNA-directed DNA polymerase n=1 Tax=Rhodobaculum claviforme TaxID=1549854 RepID=A0A934WJT2_9RHOB|nr:3'-5' exonuclease [Rhodobaculum claviforme]MBK5928262.1 DNA polymerase III subunit epsilon [Rhodobaculum claviforme]
MIARLGLRLRLLLLFAALAIASVAALVGGLWLGYDRLGRPETLDAFVQGGLVAGFGIVALTVWLWYLFDQNIGKAIEGISAEFRARAHAGLDGALNGAQARYLGDLGPAADAVTRELSQTRNALAEAVARETTRLSAEKYRLEALLSDVPLGVLLCTGEHQIVFYNSQAVDLLGTGQAPGLARGLFDYLREGPVRLAYERLAEAGDSDAASDLLCATAGSARVLAGRMRVLARRDEGMRPGYVLTLRDVTADIAAHSAREALLADVFDRVRRPAANLQTVIGVLAEEPGMPGAPALNAALVEEVRDLTTAITELGARYDEGRIDWRPLAQTRAGDLMDSIRARAEAAGHAVRLDSPDLILRCDGFELVALASTLMERLSRAGLARDFAVVMTEEDGPGGMLSLEWTGEALPVGRLDDWLTEPLEPGLPDLTGRAVLQGHGTEAWPERTATGAAIRIPIRNVRRAGRRVKPLSRAVVYDFDLLSKARNAAVADSRLEDLTYVVFDTETTGLAPSVDEICQIAAVRVVNGRRVKGEVFDTLVDPQRSIPAGSTEVHGITDQMVKGAPTIAEAGRAFHRFAQGAVLVAHNAPFDLEFLRRHEDDIGARFDHPVLDTVLLSAVVYGQTEGHSLDALTARLGITIPEAARHTAIGDTVATADAFLKLLPMLQGRGFDTFGQVLAEVRRHGRLLRDVNQTETLGRN